jgi:type IV secretory pathway VirB10-like protein
MNKTMLSLALMATLAIGLISWRAGDRLISRFRAGFTDTIPDARVCQDAKLGQAVQFPNVSTSIETKDGVKQYKIDATDVAGNAFHLIKVGETVTELTINGKEIPKEDVGQYLYIFDKILGGPDDGDEADEAEAVEPAEPAEAVEPAEPVEAVEAVEAPEAPEVEAPEMPEAPEVAEAPEAPEAPEMAEAPEAPEAPEMAEAPEAPEAPSSSAGCIRHIVFELIYRGLINAKTDLRSFSLDNSGLTVNGVRASDEVFNSLREKYVKDASDHYIYSHDGGSTTIDVRQQRGN